LHCLLKSVSFCFVVAVIMLFFQYAVSSSLCHIFLLFIFMCVNTYHVHNSLVTMYVLYIMHALPKKLLYIIEKIAVCCLGGITVNVLLCVIQIGVLMYLLYQKLGISAIIGAACCILTMTPLQFLIGKKMSTNSKAITVSVQI
jgi:hypothetical protein